MLPPREATPTGGLPDHLVLPPIEEGPAFGEDWVEVALTTALFSYPSVGLDDVEGTSAATLAPRREDALTMDLIKYLAIVRALDV